MFALRKNVGGWVGFLSSEYGNGRRLIDESSLSADDE
jgi:hypothetical protein